MTETVTAGEGVARIFIAIDHANSELVGIHAARSGNRFEALEANLLGLSPQPDVSRDGIACFRKTIRQGVEAHFGKIASGIASGPTLRHDHGSTYMSADFQSEITFLGIERSPTFVRQPEANGVAERFMRTLRENLLWVETFEAIEQLRAALQAVTRRYKGRKARARKTAR